MTGLGVVSPIGIGREAIAVLGGIVAIDHLFELTVILTTFHRRISGRCVEERLGVGCGRTCGVDPAVLDVARTGFDDTC